MQKTLTLKKQRGIYKNIIVKILSKMELGKLRLTLPDGEEIQIGNDDFSFVATINVYNNDFFRRCLLYGDIGFGESYVDGDWDTDNITNVIKWFLLNVENAPTVSGSETQHFALNGLRFLNKLFHLKRVNNLTGSKKNIAKHYDLSNDFFASFLDPSMTYSSAYFKEQNNSLHQAQIDKYDRLCRQMKLKETDHVLEIGSGWGSNAIYIANQYHCKVTTITISEEQFKFTTDRVKEEKFSEKITVLLKDYRNVEGRFDKIVSIEMLEAVGAKYYDVFFKKCAELLNKNGVMALQVITCPDSRFDKLRTGVDWIQKYIFPGSLLPSVGEINKSINNTSDLTLVDLTDLGLHYSKTLSIWFEQFNANKSKIRKLGFDENFIRMWNYYLCYCQAAFEMRNINVMQMIYVRPNNISW